MIQKMYPSQASATSTTGSTNTAISGGAEDSAAGGGGLPAGAVTLAGTPGEAAPSGPAAVAIPVEKVSSSTASTALGSHRMCVERSVPYPCVGDTTWCGWARMMHTRTEIPRSTSTST